MTQLVVAGVISSYATAQTAASPASDTLQSVSGMQWLGYFGGRPDQPTVAYSILAHGFGQAETLEIGERIRRWMLDHRAARVLTVGVIQSATAESQIRIVWVIDGADTLNLNLVRAGACQGWTMATGPDEQLLISRTAYEKFIRSVVHADSLARTARAGVWSASP